MRWLHLQCLLRHIINADVDGSLLLAIRCLSFAEGEALVVDSGAIAGSAKSPTVLVPLTAFFFLVIVSRLMERGLRRKRNPPALEVRYHYQN